MTTSDDLIKQNARVFKIIKEIDNDKLSEEFVKLCNLYIKNNEETMDFLKKGKKENEINFIQYNKLLNKSYDSDIETHHLVKEATNNFFTAVKPFFDELPNVTKAVMNSPRMAGLFLILFGKKWVYDITQMNLDKIIKETAERQNIGDVKHE